MTKSTAFPVLLIPVLYDTKNIINLKHYSHDEIENVCEQVEIVQDYYSNWVLKF